MNEKARAPSGGYKTIMVFEAIEIGTEITRIIDQITEGKILTKVMAKDLDTEA